MTYDLVRSPGYVETWAPGCYLEDSPDGCPSEDCDIAGVFTIRVMSLDGPPESVWWTQHSAITQAFFDNADIDTLDFLRAETARAFHLELAEVGGI